MPHHRSRPARRVVGTAAAVGVAASLIAAGACSRRTQRSTGNSAAAPNVIVFVLDACRVDKWGCYGFERATTPVLDALAADPDAVVYERHYAQATWTKASTASLFTGRYPFQHGVVWGHEMDQDALAPGFFSTQYLRPSLDTLAERFRAAGYATLGVAKSHHLASKYGFGQGFDVWITPDDDSPTRSFLERVVRRVSGDRLRGDLRFLDRFVSLVRETRRPFFGYLHVNGCHNPFRARERDPDYMAAYATGYDEAGRVAEGFDFGEASIKFPIKRGELELTPDDVEFLNLVYEAKLRTVDREVVAGLIRALKKSGLYDSSLLVVTADHGEELYDHHGYAHGHAVWEELAHIPLIVKFPEGRRPAGLASRFSELSQAVDLMPSILGFLGLTAPEGLAGGDVFTDEGVGRAFIQTRTISGLVVGRHKLVEERDATRLFDLVADPRERHDLAATDPETVAELEAAAAALRSRLARNDEGEPVMEDHLDEATMEDLRSLGYLE